MIVSSLVLTVLSVILGGVLAIFTAVYMVYYCPIWMKKIYEQIINLLAGIPSLIFGYFGLVALKPVLDDLFNVGSSLGLLLSTLVLSIMILPTITSLVKNSLENVPMHYYEGALALGCTKNQAVWKVCLPAAKNGVIAALILGIGRAVGETMAVQLLLGNLVNYPTGLFLPIRTLTSNIVVEFGYSTGLHREALIATGFVLLIFILIINLCLWAVKKNDSIAGNKFFSRKFKQTNSTLAQLNYKKTGSAQDILWILSHIIAILVAVMLAFIIIFVFVRGIPNISADFLFGESANAHPTLGPAFASTGMLILMALLVALPLGIGAAIFLTEYAKRGSKLVKLIRLFIDTLAGIPSIVFGLFGAIFFGTYCGMGYSLINGSLTLALIILPTIIRSTEQSLSEVPDSMREASYALGAGKLISREHTPFCEPLTVAQCIHYALTRPAVVSALVGCCSAAQVQEAVGYFNCSDAERDYAPVVGSRRNDFKGNCVYCNHCRPCPKEIDIAAVNKYLDIAKLDESAIPPSIAQHYRSLEHAASECIGCGSCEKRCPFGVPVIENMKRAARLFGR